MEDPIWRTILIVFVLLMVNAFFAAAEIAVISLNGNKLRRDAEEGDVKAGKMLKLVESPTQFLSTIQVAITLSGLLAASFAADYFSDKLVHWLVDIHGVQAISPAALNTLSLIVITVILAYFTLVLGELVPKRLAMTHPERMARFACGPITVLWKLFKPVVWLLGVSTNAMLRLLRVDPEQSGSGVSEEEIRLLVDIGEEKGAIEADEKRMIENIFEFNNITAEDVMVHRMDMVVVWLDDKPEEIVRLIAESGLSRFPVCGDDIDDIIGVLRTREFLLNLHREQPRPLSDLLAPVYFVPESVPADVLFREMQKKKMHMAVVVDEYGGTSGLVTLEDLLEEIVGNIYDEFDPTEVQDLMQLEDNLWRVAGGIEIEELMAALGLPLPEEEEFETLGGLVFSRLSEIPADGAQPEIIAYGLKIKVDVLAERRVEWALVSKLPPEEQAAEKE